MDGEPSVADKRRGLDWAMGQKIKAVRESKGVSQDDLAKKTNIPVETIRDGEAGKIRLSPGDLVRIADALGIPITDALRVDSPVKRIANDNE